MKSILATVSLALALSASSACANKKTAGESVDDSWLHTKVKTALVGHGSSDINIEVYHGVVQLTGFLTDATAKQAAVAAAQGVEGVKSVTDHLHVVTGDRSAGEVLDDNTLTTKVKAALTDGSLAGINVEVNRGVVLLSGFADDAAARTRATEIAQGVSGVVQVLNGIDLKT